MLPTRFDQDGGVELGAAKIVQAETAPVVLFLLELYKASPHSEYLAAARKGLAFLDRDVIPGRKWYDFETFWSCSPRLIAFDERTRQWPANDLALIHATAAYLAAYQVTRERAYLDRGEALLDYLLLYQQSWTNPVLEGLTGPAMLLGGFTTQNSDAEWSDAPNPGGQCSDRLLPRDGQPRIPGAWRGSVARPVSHLAVGELGAWGIRSEGRRQQLPLGKRQRHGRH